MTDKEKTSELLRLIDVLCNVNFAKNQEEIDNWVDRLNRVYSNNYRHTYSDIFFKIQQLMSDSLTNDSVSDAEVLEVLGENLNVLGNRIDELAVQNSDDANYKNTVSGYKKFSDHIRLEIGRYNFIKSRFKDSEEARNSGKESNICFISFNNPMPKGRGFHSPKSDDFSLLRSQPGQHHAVPAGFLCF